MLLSQLPSCKRAEIENLEDLKLWEQFPLFALSEAAGFHSLVSSPFSLYLQMSLGLLSVRRRWEPSVYRPAAAAQAGKRFSSALEET